jgi:hypothetical protein
MGNGVLAKNLGAGEGKIFVDRPLVGLATQERPSLQGVENPFGIHTD